MALLLFGLGIRYVGERNGGTPRGALSELGQDHGSW